MTLILNGTDNSATVPAVQGGTAGTTTGVYYPTTSAVGISTAGTNAVYINASQNVGIGTSSPNQKLQVNNTAAASSFALFTNSTTGSTGGDGTYFGVDSSGVAYAWNQENTAMLFGTNNGERMRIDASGNVGIGTSSTSTKFTVSGTQTIRGTGTDYGSFTCLYMDDSTSPYTGVMAGYTLSLNTGNNSARTSRLYIDNSGNVLVGLTAQGLSGLFEVNGAVSGYSTLRFPYIGSSTGTAVIIDASGYLRASSSSRRYKENIEPIDVGLDLVMQMQPVKYNLKEGGIAQVGFIAEDFPESRLVNYSMIDPTDAEKGEQVESVNYTNLTAILTKAIQEQQALITTLTARIEALEAK